MKYNTYIVKNGKYTASYGATCVTTNIGSDDPKKALTLPQPGVKPSLTTVAALQPSAYLRPLT